MKESIRVRPEGHNGAADAEKIMANLGPDIR
jgi:hypothetical protein